MEKETVDVMVEEGVEVCSVIPKACRIGKALLITGAIGTAALIGVKLIKKIRAKKAAKNQTVNAENGEA